MLEIWPFSWKCGCFLPYSGPILAVFLRFSANFLRFPGSAGFCCNRSVAELSLADDNDASEESDVDEHTPRSLPKSRYQWA